MPRWPGSKCSGAAVWFVATLACAGLAWGQARPGPGFIPACNPDPPTTLAFRNHCVGANGTQYAGNSSNQAVSTASGAADLSAIWSCTSGDCSTLTGAAGDTLDAGSADASKPATRSTTLPATCTEGQWHQDTNSGDAETYICTDTDTWTKLPSVNATSILFSDPDNNFSVANIDAALAELDDVNGSGPNASDGKVEWSQLVGVPAALADASIALGSETTGDYVSGVTANQGLLKTGTEGATLGFIDCAANEILKRNAGDTAWECATDASGSGGTPNVLDLGDDSGNDSTDLVEIATTGDTNNIFTEPSANKLLINVGLAWPLAAEATALETARTIGGVSFDGTANIVPATITVADTTDTTSFVLLGESATGDLAPKTDAGLAYNAGTGVLTATGFAGPLVGNVTGNVTGNVSGTITVADTTDTTSFVLLGESATGDLAPKTDAGLAYNAGTGVLTATGFAGPLTGNVTGVASTATALATPRAIGGVAFDGTAAIVPGTITVADTTDTTSFVALWESATGDLAPKTDAGVTYNAATGILTATGFAGPLTGNVTGNASTATALAANPADCSANQFATTIAASGALTCAAIVDADVPDTLTASNYLPLAGGTMTGQLITDNLGIELEESDTNPTCSTGNFNIFADLSDAVVKVCNDGVVSSLTAPAATPPLDDVFAQGKTITGASSEANCLHITNGTDGGACIWTGGAGDFNVVAMSQDKATLTTWAHKNYPGSNWSWTNDEQDLCMEWNDTTYALTIHTTDNCADVLTVNVGASFGGDVIAAQETYDATTWNGDTALASRDNVRDKIESILDGQTFTGDVIVPDEAYTDAGFNGDLGAMTRNAYRDARRVAPNTQTGTTYTMTDDDCGNTIRANGNNIEVELLADMTGCRVCFFAKTEHTITLDPNSTDAFTVATSICGASVAAGNGLRTEAIVGANVCLSGVSASEIDVFWGTGTCTDVD